MAAFPAHAAVRFQSLDPGKNVNLGTWPGVGSMTLNVDFCAVSFSGNGQNAVSAPYQLRVANQDAALVNASFQLSNLNDPTQALLVDLDFIDQYSNGFETLSPNTWTAQDKTGALNQCPLGNNARILLTLQEASLAAVFGGSYRGSFTVEAMGGDGGTESKSTFFTINLTINSLVQISGLNDFLFPFYLGSGDLSLSDSFCIYRNGAGTYQVTLSGSGAGGAFVINNGIQDMPYQVTYDDGTGAVAVTANTPLTNRQNIFNANLSCDGGINNNATLALTLLQADLINASQGNYTGILTIMVAPE
ncbi:MAG TPA: hypothetical protein VIN71_07280 [Pseudomonadales bacterium]